MQHRLKFSHELIKVICSRIAVFVSGGVWGGGGVVGLLFHYYLLEMAEYLCEAGFFPNRIGNFSEHPREN